MLFGLQWPNHSLVKPFLKILGMVASRNGRSVGVPEEAHGSSGNCPM
jgi:hypothetical protein